MGDANFSAYLNGELVKRQSSNSSYSLRAFARDLDIEPSLLSKILRKKIPITLKMLDRLAPSVGLVEPELISYREYVKSSEGIKHFDNMLDVTVQHEEFKLIQNWYNITIVELTLLADFKPETAWIAAKLGISEDDARLAVERLISLGFLQKTEDGKLIKSGAGSSGLRIISDDYTSYIQALRHSISQFSDKAMQALHDIPNTHRTNAALTVAIDSSLVTETKKKIMNFTCALVDDLEKKSQKKDHVYELMISFFPLTKD
ncbi:MAG: TIGR02147 family protein [Bdellovibrionota bacterium]